MQALAALNPEINYQGKLLDSSGGAVADGNYHMYFRLYDQLVGGSPLWEGDRSGLAGNRVPVTNGLFSVMLGSSTPLTSVDFNQTLYLEVEIGGTASSSFETLSPRKRIGSVPSAFEADNATTFDGLATTSFLRSDQADTMAVTAAGTALTITQSGTGDILNLFDGVSEVFTVEDGGNVGVGTTTPYATLSVDGDLALTGGLYDSTATRGTDGQILQTDGSVATWVSTSSLCFADTDTTLTENEVEAFVFDADAETITGNWVNTANPWADNEVSDTLTIGASGAVDDNALSSNVTLLGSAIDLGGAEVAGTLDLSDHVNLSANTGIDLTGDILTLLRTHTSQLCCGVHGRGILAECQNT